MKKTSLQLLMALLLIGLCLSSASVQAKCLDLYQARLFQLESSSEKRQVITEFNVREIENNLHIQLDALEDQSFKTAVISGFVSFSTSLLTVGFGLLPDIGFGAAELLAVSSAGTGLLGGEGEAAIGFGRRAKEMASLQRDAERRIERLRALERELSAESNNEYQENVQIVQILLESYGFESPLNLQALAIALHVPARSLAEAFKKADKSGAICQKNHLMSAMEVGTVAASYLKI